MLKRNQASIIILNVSSHHEHESSECCFLLDFVHCLSLHLSLMKSCHPSWNFPDWYPSHTQKKYPLSFKPREALPLSFDIDHSHIESRYLGTCVILSTESLNLETMNCVIFQFSTVRNSQLSINMFEFINTLNERCAPLI